MKSKYSLNPDDFRDSRGQKLGRIPDRVRVSAVSLVEDDQGRFLLQKRSDNGWWGLPGGGLEPGETFKQCVVRETFEETGVIVEPINLVKIYDDPKDLTCVLYPNGDLVQYVSALFYCKKISGYLKLSDESTDIGYFPITNLPDPTLPSVNLRVEDYIKLGE
jgi:ADP-ribose pyrophosphatase YjhB (NUDIX family)